MEILLTDRLILRSFSFNDSSAFYDYAKHELVGPMAGWKPHESPEESAKLIDNFIREQDVWAITLKADGTLIGSIGLHKDGKRNYGSARMVGYAIGQPYWGNGYAPEATRRVLRYAFEDLFVNLVAISHFDFNLQSQRVIEKCGFIKEGVLRNAFRRYDGVILDEHTYSMTKMEYQNTKKSW